MNLFKKVPKNVLVLGIVSLFNDIASEMIYPIVPIFLTSVLGAPVAVVGFIEGVAEATASLMRLATGYLSDKIQKRKVFVVWGYSFSAVSKLLIGLATSWYFVLFARFIDRVGKGIRTSARDSLLLQSATGKNKGFIFGFHRAFDSAGAVLGPIAALILLALLKENIRLIFFLAFIPSFFGVILLIFLVGEKKQERLEKFKFSFKWKTLNPSFKLFFIISMLFALGNSSDAFLILRSKNLGLTTTLVILAYVTYNLSQTIFSTPAGQLADKIGARKVYAYGLIVFAFVYSAFALVNNPFWIWILFPIYGSYIAFTDGVSKAYISEFIDQRESGTYFGMYQTGIALTSFLASFIAGILWSVVSPSATFFYGAGLALLAFLVLSYGRIIRKV